MALPTYRHVLQGAVLALALTLTGCGSGDAPAGRTGTSAPGSPAASDQTHNDADIAFVTGMVPHHEQAVEMSDIIVGKGGGNPEILALAQQIKSAQAPEIEQMNEWLETWGVAPGDESQNGHGGHGGGMLSPADVDKLRRATGAEAAELFLTGMIAHHEGAIRMARTELEQGENREAKELAQRIVDGQTAEIEQMRDLLDQ